MSSTELAMRATDKLSDEELGALAAWVVDRSSSLWYLNTHHLATTVRGRIEHEYRNYLASVEDGAAVIDMLLDEEEDEGELDDVFGVEEGWI